jgi:uncharacterized protein
MDGVETLRGFRLCLPAVALLVCLAPRAVAADAPLPALTAPVNDFAHIIDGASAADIDQLSRALQAATGDTVVVATIDTFAPYGDIRDYAVKLFENGGRGIGEKGKDNGVLILLAKNERRVWIEVGYGLEQWITDGFAGETSRDVMVPEFRSGRYGAGLAAGTARIVGRIADARHVTLQNVRLPASRRAPAGNGNTGFPWAVIIFIIVMILLSRRGGRRGIGGAFWPLFWGGRGWSGWSSGVGPFGGNRWGGGGWGGGGGGGFGGFGGGGSGGGGGGAGW